MKIEENLQPHGPPELGQPPVCLLQDVLPGGVLLAPDAVEAEDDPLALDADVAAELHDALPPVVSGVQVAGDLPEHDLGEKHDTLELQTKVCEDFTVTEALTSAFTLLRHY